jgi:hypothetical protein
MKTTSVGAKALGHALQSGTLKRTLCALLAGTALCGLSAPASAQAPTYRNLDSNGVDLVKGDFLTSFAEGSVGSGDSELALFRMLGSIASGGAKGSSQFDNITFNLSPSGDFVQFGTRADMFPGAESRGASLTGSGAQFFYGSPDGTRIEFTDPSPGNDPVYCDGVQTACILLPTTITSPDRKAVTINYEFYVRCQSPDGPDSTVCQNVPRIASVANSFGYEIRFAYAVGTGGTGPVSPAFHQRTGASFYNNVTGSAPLASVSYSYPSSGVTDITDQGGRVWRVTSGSTNYAVQRPGAPSNTLSASLSGGVVSSRRQRGRHHQLLAKRLGKHRDDDCDPGRPERARPGDHDRLQPRQRPADLAHRPARPHDRLHLRQQRPAEGHHRSGGQLRRAQLRRPRQRHPDGGGAQRRLRADHRHLGEL